MLANFSKPGNMPLRVLADENIPGALVNTLREWKIDVVKVESGATDTEVAKRARQEDRILVTFDADFCNIITYPPERFSGIVRLNIHPPLTKTIIAALHRLLGGSLTAKNFKGRLIVVGPMSLRVWGGELDYLESDR